MEKRSLDLSAMEIFRDEAIQAGEIIALYVLKDYYGKGVSEQLMHAAFVALDQFSEIYLWVLKDNKRAIAFYQKNGFYFLMAKNKYLNLENLLRNCG